MKVDQFRVEVIEVDVGWMPIKLHFDDTTIEFEASEIGREPLATFIESIVALQEFGKACLNGMMSLIYLDLSAIY